MDDFTLYLLSGMLGNHIAEQVVKHNRKVKIPFFVLYAVFFALIYSMALVLYCLAYWTNGAEIAWKGIGIFSMSVSFLIVACLYVLDKARRQ